MRNVAVVAHTHWDREWYLPFETLRARLVKVLDEALDVLDHDGGFSHFHLDGQVAVVDDYLAARPSSRARLARLAGDGRLAVGPWYCLMDEFCVSGETVVRNLELGVARARRIGGLCEVGYLPDMFGHVAQMPQILVSAGIRHAVVWRGVGAEVEATAFRWRSPDGTEVRCEYLPAGYAVGAYMPDAWESLVERTADYETQISEFLSADQTLLFMCGGDHHAIPGHLPATLAAANDSQEAYRFELTDLTSYLSRTTSDDLGVVAGELRSNFRAPLLPGVLSTRVDVKQACAEAEMVLEKLAEPLATLWLPQSHWPDSLEGAWLDMVRNSAHDSVCGCSADPVSRAVLARYDSAVAVASTAVCAALAVASVATATQGLMVVNPSAFARCGLVEITLPGCQPPDGVQVLSAYDGATVQRAATGRDLATMLDELTAHGWIGGDAPIVDAAVSPKAAGTGVDVHLRTDAAATPDPRVAGQVAAVWAKAGATKDDPLLLSVTRAGSLRVLARVRDVPGYGWAMLERCQAAPTESVSRVAVTRDGRAVIVDNGILNACVDLATGDLTVGGVPGLNAICEEPDAGDAYNFAPLPGETAQSQPYEVDVEVTETGPLRGRVRVSRTYTWGSSPPAVAADERRPGKSIKVVSQIEVRCDEKVVRVTTSFDNTVRDHRVRVVFPLDGPVASTVAECAFATVERVHSPKNPGLSHRVEAPPVTFPSRRFVTAGRLTVLHRGLLEYGLSDDGRVLALTLLRGTGRLAAAGVATRPVTAGPSVGVEEAQLLGRRTFEYALAPDCEDPFKTADSLWNPLIALRAAGGGMLADRGSRLEIEGCVVSSLRRVAGCVEVRVFNPTGTPVTVRMPGRSGQLVELSGRTVAGWSETFDLGAWRFATARIDGAELD